MKAAQNYIEDVVSNINYALEQMPLHQAARRKLSMPETGYEIDRYVRNLLTRKEQQSCDRATD